MWVRKSGLCFYVSNLWQRDEVGSQFINVKWLIPPLHAALHLCCWSKDNKVFHHLSNESVSERLSFESSFLQHIILNFVINMNLTCCWSTVTEHGLVPCSGFNPRCSWVRHLLQQFSNTVCSCDIKASFISPIWKDNIGLGLISSV